MRGAAPEATSGRGRESSRTHMKRGTRCAGVTLGAAMITGCAVGPGYQRPTFDAAIAYKESGDWKASEPNDVLSRGPWWNLFGDDDLTRLEARVDISNENIKAAAASFDQARALG